MGGRLSAIVVVVSAAACGTPTTPKPGPPPVVGPATPPVIRSITVPTSRVEAGRDVSITAVVEDAETPLTQLSYQWSASAGTITGSGTTAIWRIPGGLTSGVNVTVTLTVTDLYDAVDGNIVVKRQFVVSQTSAPFRVHDSEAEVKELGRKFLVDLFGNSKIPAVDCVVDFADECAAFAEGKTAELEQIIEHRKTVIVHNVTMLAQRVTWNSADFGSVHSAMLYHDQFIGGPPKAPTCGDFEITVLYVRGRWWICQSFFNRNDTSHCPAAVDNAAVGAIMRGRGTGMTSPGVPR